MFGLAILSCAALLASGRVVLPNGLLSARRASTTDCPYVVDVAAAIDSTSSELDNAAELKADSAKIVNYVRDHPGWRMALATFTDKPIPPLGWDKDGWLDYCLSLQAPFTNDKDDLSKLLDKINRIYLAGGYDFPEAQLEALIRTLKSYNIGWRRETKNEEGIPIQRVIVIATDSIAHRAGDAKTAAEKLHITPPVRNTITETDILNHGENYRCDEVDYPDMSRIRGAIKDKDAIPIFLVAPGSYTCEIDGKSQQCVFPELEKLADQTGNEEYRDPQKGMELFYTELIKEIGTPGIVVPMGRGFKGIGDAFIEAMVELGTIVHECGSTTTTSTTTTPTTATTTTPTTTTTTVTTATTTTTTTTTTTATTTTPTTTVTTATTTTTTTTTTTPSTAASTDTTATTTTQTTEETVDSSVPIPTLPTPTPSTSSSTTTTTTTTSSEGTCLEDCTVRVDMVIEKCDGEVVTETLIV